MVELFGVAFSYGDDAEDQSLFLQVQQELQLLHRSEALVKAEFARYPGYGIIRVEAEMLERDVDMPLLLVSVKEALAEAIAGFIVADKEPAILRHLIIKEFHYDKTADVEAIEGYCQQSLQLECGGDDGLLTMNSSPSKQRRKGMLKELLSHMLGEHPVLNLDGFLAFRIQEYKEELREIVEYAIDEFMMDRQYQEFISLLQYFVYIQEAKIPAVHLIHKGGHEFVILNDKMEPIDASDLDTTLRMEVLEKDINFEDMIVSTLISVSPANIYIHTRDADLTIIKTIRQIFEDRTSVCSYCRTCDLYLGEGKKHDQLSP
ncbi:putative sporulation protein YtxC [Paenibacillus whitsoniae]|uniref:Putative sporulation protein YtxC n=1 Tax=Paenibacillus whitsoniae TaxID=2496558 RepID=A0A430J540_9BACL|nr:putative sporulation protein YtxC [Paenibacillus whitsoniae]